MVKKKYEIALSFAGEDREYVEHVAHVLRAADVRVFYDSFEEHVLLGKNLVEELQRIYRDESTYVVIFCSQHYLKRPWARYELQSAQERAIKEHSEYILPARFDDTEIPGISSTTGHIDLRKRKPEEAAAILLRKLGVIDATQAEEEEAQLAKILRIAQAEQLDTRAQWTRWIEYDWHNDHSTRLRDSFLGELVGGELGRTVEPNSWMEFLNKYELTPDQADDVIECYFDEVEAHQAIQKRLQDLGHPIPSQSGVSPAHVLLVLIHLYLIEKQSAEQHVPMNAFMKSSNFCIQMFRKKIILDTYVITRPLLPNDIMICVDEFISQNIPH